MQRLQEIGCSQSKKQLHRSPEKTYSGSLSRKTQHAWHLKTLWYLKEHALFLASKKVKSQPKLKDTLLPAQEDDVLELDELWSFVRFRKNKRWIWTVMCRRTRQIIAFAIEDRSVKTCKKLWKRIPVPYRGCHSFSDFWDAYEKVFPEETHRSVGKDCGETNHMERWNCTLRQRVARFVRKTLSYSKAEYMHHIVTRWFIVEYNLSILHKPCT